MLNDPLSFPQEGYVVKSPADPDNYVWGTCNEQGTRVLIKLVRKKEEHDGLPAGPREIDGKIVTPIVLSRERALYLHDLLGRLLADLGWNGEAGNVVGP